MSIRLGAKWSQVQMRLIGTPESVAAVLDHLAALGADIDASAMYSSRYSTGHVRIYAEITPARPADGSEK
ncbi:hypothetical protein [Nocardia sienata]|uniref:hypothetical protein n=1 Tax=Nocardia sienata TaxID=248552 RepID=UPI000B043A78|nr:hypothetical protein [Nocardia sienata]